MQQYGYYSYKCFNATLLFISDDAEPAVEDKPQPTKSKLHCAQALFPSTLCTAFVQVIALLDDQAVSLDGTAVYDVAYEVVWSCLVEDSNLFLKYFMEKLTRDEPAYTFQGRGGGSQKVGEVPVDLENLDISYEKYDLRIISL